MPFSDSILGSFPYRMLGEIDQPTNTQGMQNAQFGGSPQALQQLLMSPGMQHQMNMFGMGGYDGSQIKQSPFFPNPFMQHHPQFGGALTGMMANGAMTPDAPMVSGAGSGISRAFQGMMGGPEMLRQYQIKQMMAPFGMQAAMMPAREMERKESMLQTLQDAISGQQQFKQNQLEQQQRLKEGDQRLKAGEQELKYPKPEITPTDWGYIQRDFHPGRAPIQTPQAGQSGAGFPMMGGVNIPGVSPGWSVSEHQRTPEQTAGMGQKYEAQEAPKRKTKFGVEDKKQSGADRRSQAGIASREKIAGGQQAVRSAGDQLRQIQSQYQIDLRAAGGDQQKIQQIQQQYEGPGGLFEQMRKGIPRQQYVSPEAPGTGGPNSQQNAPPPEPTHTLNGRPIAYNGKQWVFTDQKGGVAQ